MVGTGVRGGGREGLVKRAREAGWRGRGGSRLEVRWRLGENKMRMAEGGQK